MISACGWIYKDGAVSTYERSLAFRLECAGEIDIGNTRKWGLGSLSMRNVQREGVNIDHSFVRDCVWVRRSAASDSDVSRTFRISHFAHPHSLRRSLLKHGRMAYLPCWVGTMSVPHLASNDQAGECRKVPSSGRGARRESFPQPAPIVNHGTHHEDPDAMP